jgi:hypothetical protein
VDSIRVAQGDTNAIDADEITLYAVDQTPVCQVLAETYTYLQVGGCRYAVANDSCGLLTTVGSDAISATDSGWNRGACYVEFHPRRQEK